MKTYTRIRLLLVTTFATALAVGTACAQPNLHVNPASGMPEAQPGTGDLTPVSAIQEASQTRTDVRSLIFNGRYDEALQRCLAFHDKYKAGNSLTLLLSDWVELSRRFPKAKSALIEIRDHDIHEFSAGRGYSELFAEINSINGALGQDAATYSLFKSFRDKDPDLAQQCYFYVQNLLVARGDYQWCYDHMGDPQGRFDSIRQSLTMQLDHQKRMAAMNEANKQRIAEMNRQRGWTNLPSYSPPDTAAMMQRSAENNFVGQTRQLIEIMVATGHKAGAERIRDQAVAALDDERLKSAVADAEAKTAR